LFPPTTARKLRLSFSFHGVTPLPKAPLFQSFLLGCLFGGGTISLSSIPPPHYPLENEGRVLVGGVTSFFLFCNLYSPVPPSFCGYPFSPLCGPMLVFKVVSFFGSEILFLLALLFSLPEELPFSHRTSLSLSTLWPQESAFYPHPLILFPTQFPPPQGFTLLAAPFSVHLIPLHFLLL